MLQHEKGGVSTLLTSRSVVLLILLMNLRDLSSVSSRKHQYSSGRFQYILDSNLTTVHLLQLFLCQLLSLLAVHLILLHNRINFKLLNLLVQRYDKFRQIPNI